MEARPILHKTTLSIIKVKDQTVQLYISYLVIRGGFHKKITTAK